MRFIAMFPRFAPAGRLAFVVWIALAAWPAIAQQDPLDEARSLYRRVTELYQQGRYADAIPLQVRVVELSESVFGSESLTIVATLDSLAELYRLQGRNADAEPLFARSLSNREKALGSEHPQVAGSLLRLADIVHLQNRYEAAEPLYLRSITIWEKAFGPDHDVLARVLANLAELYSKQRRHAEAEVMLKRFLVIKGKAFGIEHREIATGLELLAELYRVQGRYGEAEPLVKRALAIKDKALGPDDPGTAYSLNFLALLYRGLGRYAEAVPLLTRTLAIQVKLRGPEHPDAALSLNNLAEIYRDLARYTEAEPLYRRSLAIWEKVLGLDHLNVALALNNLALVCDQLGRYAEAERLHQRALTIKETKLGPEHLDVATSLNNLAELYDIQGRYAEAEPLYKRSLSIREKAHGVEHLEVANTLTNLAAHYADQGRFGDAVSLLERTLAINEKALGVEHPAVAQSLSSLAASRRSLDRLADVEPLYKRSLAIDEKTFGFEHPSITPTLQSLGSLYREQGRYAEAALMLSRSLTIGEKMLGPEHPGVAISLTGLANMNVALGQYAIAESQYRRALSIRERALGPEHPSVAGSLASIAALLVRLGRVDEALGVMRRAMEIRAKRALHSASRDGSGVDSERRNVRNSFIDFLAIASLHSPLEVEQLVLLAMQAFVAAQLAAQSSADWALAQASARFAVSNDTLAQLMRERQDAVSRRAKLDKALVVAFAQPREIRDAMREQTIRDEIKLLDRTLDVIDERLRQEFPEFAELSNPQPLALDWAQHLLRSDEALVAFVVADDAIYRFLVRSDNAEFRRLEIKPAVLEEQVLALRQNLELASVRSLAELRAYDFVNAHELYKALFAGLEPLLAGASRLLIVPDGPLGGLPFSALLTKAPPASVNGFADYRQADWLMRRYAITVQPSIGSLRASRMFSAKAQMPREPFLGFADPELTGRSGDIKGARSAKTRLASRGAVADVTMIRELPELPDSAEEVRKIARSLGADPVTSTYLRAQATERRVKSIDLSRYRVLVFATHGLMAGEFAGYGEPALVLTPPARGDEIDDGLLSASEVAQLKLNADWVILSACNTAAPDGSPAAEGLSGLARAFFYAGSRALLVSHWPVYSDASVRLTTGAIEVLAKNPSLGRAEALRRSMLTLLNDPLPPEYSHPAIWAPFSLVGEGGTGH